MGVAMVQFGTVSKVHCSPKTHLSEFLFTQLSGTLQTQDFLLGQHSLRWQVGKGGGVTAESLPAVLQRPSGAPAGSHADPREQPTQPAKTETTPKLVVTLADVRTEKNYAPSATNMIPY